MFSLHLLFSLLLLSFLVYSSASFPLSSPSSRSLSQVSPLLHWSTPAGPSLDKLFGPGNAWLADIVQSPVTPYRLSVGRRRWGSDVIKDDVVQSLYDSDRTLNNAVDIDEIADFFLWRDEPTGSARENTTTSTDRTSGTAHSSKSSSRSVQMQKPVLFVDEADMVTATVEGWGARSLKKVPKLPGSLGSPSGSRSKAGKGAESVGFSLSAVCKNPGSTLITITARVFEMTMGQRSRQIYEWRVKRTCEHESSAAGFIEEDGQVAASTKSNTTLRNEATAESSAVSGFDVRFVENGQSKEVVTDGRPSEMFKPRQSSSREDSSAENERAVDLAYHIDSNQNRWDVQIVYQLVLNHALKLNKPLVHVEKPEILQVAWSLSKSSVAPGKPTQLSLSFSCLQSGLTSFTVILTFLDDFERQVSFGAVKVCQGSERIIGVTGSMIDVGVGDECGEEVVDDGETQLAYKNVARWTKGAWKGRIAPISGTVTSMEFCVSTNNKEASFIFDPPQISSFTSDGTVIAQPLLSGPMMAANADALIADKPQTLVLTFFCQKAGIVAVTISIPVANVGIITWTLRKKCPEITVSALGEGEVQHEADNSDGSQTTVIPGLNLGLSRTQSGQMCNGVVNSAYRLQKSSHDLVFCPSKRQFLSFYLYQNVSVENAVSVRYGHAQLTATNDITSPILSGDIDGGVVNETSFGAFTITFHCHTDGETMYTLRIPIEGIDPLSLPPRPAIVIQFMKLCNSSDKVPTAEMGGVGIFGFRIGHSANADDPESQSVVRDGFPTVPYFGQQNRDEPDWEGVIVPPHENSTRLYLNYHVVGENVGNQYVIFYPPRLVFHSSFFEPTLSGPATRGGKIRKNTDSPPHLDITYNCQFKGLVILTLVIPFPSGSITFTIPKLCNGRAVATGRVYPGLNIGLAPGGSEVVKDGLVQRDFGRTSHYIVGPNDEVTVFYLQKLGGDVFQAIEPMVRAVHPIVYPMLSHDLYVSVGPQNELLLDNSGDTFTSDGDLMADETDDVYLDERIATLNITYQCMDEGETPITVSFPLKVGYIDFTWMKKCLFPLVHAGVHPGNSHIVNPSSKSVQDDDGGETDAPTTIAGVLEEKNPSQAQQDQPDGGVPQHDPILDPILGGGTFELEADEIEIESRFQEQQRIAQEKRALYQNNNQEDHSLDQHFARVNVINVATSPELALSNKPDIINKGKLSQEWIASSKLYEKNGIVSSLVNFYGTDVNEVTFYVHTTSDQQAVGVPEIIWPKRAKHAPHVLKVNLKGPLVGVKREQTILYKDENAKALTLQFLCQPGHGGVIPLIVELPLIPKSAAQPIPFTIYKQCSDTRSGGVSRASNHGFYALLTLLVGGAVLASLYYLKAKGKDLDIAAMLELNKKSLQNKIFERGSYEIVKNDER